MNLANKLTLARILLVPFFMYFLLIHIKYGNYIAAGFFILAAATDGLDGYIARSRHMVTKLGKFLDPIADKLLISAALISLVEMKQLSSWIAFIIIGREFIVSGLRMVCASDGVVVAASKLGKLKTISQIVAIIILILHGFPFSLLGTDIGVLAGKITMGIAVILTVWSGGDYIYKARRILMMSEK